MARAQAWLFRFLLRSVGPIDSTGERDAFLTELGFRVANRPALHPAARHLAWAPYRAMSRLRTALGDVPRSA